MNAHKSYLVKWGPNQYKVYTWVETCRMYSESMSSFSYHQARAYVGSENCRNPQTCTKSTHDHTEV